MVCFLPKISKVAVCCFPKRRSGRGLETCAMEVREILIKKIEKGCQATLVFASREGGGLLGGLRRGVLY